MHHIHRFVYTVCWSMLVLSLVGTWAGSGADPVLPPSGSHAGLPQHAMAPASDRPVPSLLKGSEAPTPAAARLTLIALADPSLAATAARRTQLTYLVRCALPAGVVLYTEQDGTRFTFPGELGLAPRWVDEALTPREERWVSACLLAHVNAVGASVRISLRATPPPVPALTVTADEAQHFSMFEGGFFGNLFAPEPVAYTCQGTRPPAQAYDPLWQQRLCTQATGETTAASMPITACRLLLTGPCEDPSSLTVQGIAYTEVIFTYLRPSLPALALSTDAPAPFGGPGWPPDEILP